MKTRSFLTLCVFLLCMTCPEAKEGNRKKDRVSWTDPVRIASYNIQYDNLKDQDGMWANRKEMMKRILQETDFDIFGAQEPFLFQIRDMESWLPEYSWIGTSITGEQDVERRHFNPVFYKKDKFEVLDSGTFWYSETPDVPNSKGWDAYSVRNCNWVKFKVKATGEEFFMFNSHFDHLGAKAKAESAHLLISKVEEIAGDLPAICTGDFNSNQNSSVYTIIVASHVLYDSYSIADNRKNDEWPTYNGYKYQSTPPANPTRIDHIFVNSKKNKVMSWTNFNIQYNYRYPSDHNPIMVEWSFEKQ